MLLGLKFSSSVRNWIRNISEMSSRRSMSTSPPSSSRPAKRQRLDHLTSESFKNGVMLAPMVRSGVLPTRLFALKYGAKLVWGPEIIDKAILHAERVVDPRTGVISYNGKSKAMFTTHSIEKPYLIYQIGSSNPELAVEAAKTVQQDVSGIDLNCGCPKPFSTHAGMGAALLSDPDLLCSILVALRQAMPPEITVSAKIRLLPSQEDTLKLVERIVNTGISALTVHCRTRNMRKNEKAVIERLREIVEFVEGMGKGIAVIHNGDCLSAEDAIRVLEITGAHSCMIATAAESNPSCFSSSPLVDLERTLIPSYVRLCKYLDNHWANTKFCVNQFKGSHEDVRKIERKELKEAISKSKSYEDLGPLLGDVWDGEREMQEIIKAVEARSLPFIALRTVPDEAEYFDHSEQDSNDPDESVEYPLSTPPESRPNPEPSVLDTPRLPINELRIPIPAGITGQDFPTPTPTPSPYPHPA